MTAVFYVQREVMHHIMQTYVPTALIVVISWFNFWLDIDSAPARVSLSITTVQFCFIYFFYIFLVTYDCYTS